MFHLARIYGDGITTKGRARIYMLAQHNCFELAFKSRHWPLFGTTPIDHSGSPSGSASSVRSGVAVGASTIARSALPLRTNSPIQTIKIRNTPTFTLFNYSPIHPIHIFTLFTYYVFLSPSFAMPLPHLRLPLPRLPLPLLRAGLMVCFTKLVARIVTRSTTGISIN